MILADGVIGQTMEKVELSDYKPRWTEQQIEEMHGNWAANGKKANRNQHIVTSLELVSERQKNSTKNFRQNTANRGRRSSL
jgi:2-oxoglutarate ferredoxin oxidoreductase subunit alpha